MSDDEEDPVVQELPVLLSHSLENQLYVLQYPTRPAGLDNDNKQILKCCFKPENQELLLELAVDTASNNYDVSHGEQIALNVDGGRIRQPNDRFFQSSLMDKRTLQSTRVAMDTERVAVATIKNKQLIITPIKGVLEVQPSFPHLDVTDKRAKEEAREMGEEVSGGEEEESEKQVTVKFARQETERVKKAREQSYNHFSKKSAEEKWYDTQYHLPSSRLSEMERNRLTAVPLEDQLGSMCLQPQQYMDALAPVQEDPSWGVPAGRSSLTALTNLPLPDVVLAILKEVKIMTFQQLSGVLTGVCDAVKLLRSVQQVAVLVQGNWVVRSECLYPPDTFSRHNGVAAEVMCRARDYILYRLSEGQELERRQVSGTVRLPTEELTELLSQVARLRRHRRWQLTLPPDNDFIQRNPEVVERQTRAWAAKYKQLVEAFEQDSPSGKGARSRRRESSMSGGSDLEGSARPRAPPPRQRKDSSFSSDAESGAESGHRRRNRTDSGDGKQRKKRNSESNTDAKVNGKLKRTKSQMASPEPCS